MLISVSSFADTSLLWGTNGELWNNTYPLGSISGRIADCSHAGYQGGDVPVPFYPVAVVVTDYGAVPDDGMDDSAAIQAAIDACPTNTGSAVHIPEGTFDLTNTIYLNKPNIVLRGAGPEQTVLRVANGITGIYLDGDTTKQGLSQIMGFSRGDMVITNSALGNQAQVGDLIYATIYLSTAHDIAFSNLLEQCVGGVQIPQFSGSVSCQMYGKVVSKSGSKVTLDRPLEYSYQGPTLAGINKKWGLGIMRPVMHDTGVEDMTVTFDPNYPYAKHFNGTAPGPINEEDTESHAVYLRACVNCWVRNVIIKEACSGLSSYGDNVQCTISDVTLEATRMSQSEFPLQSGYDYDYALQFDTPLISNYWDVRGHAAVQLAGEHMLAERIRLRYAALHDLTINSTANSVFSDVKGFDISLDHHRQNGSRNLWTQIDTGLGRKFWLSSGVNADGIQCGAWETFWNIDSDMNQDFPSWAPTGNAFCRGYLNLVGLRTVAAPVTDAAPRWFEANINPGEIAQPNLYQAMRMKRFAARGWDSVPPVARASADNTQGRGTLTVNFTGSTSSDNVGIVSYLWNFDDGYTSWTTNPQHTYTQPGIYTAKFVVCDGRNLYDTAEITITVLESDAQYKLAYELAGSAELWNYAYSNTFPSFTLSGLTNQVVAEGGFGTTVVAVPMSGYRFVAWSDGVTNAARAETNVLESKVLTAYYMPGTASISGSPPTDLALDANIVDDSATNGTPIGSVTATDSDPDETFLYQLADDAGGRFAIHPYTGQIFVADGALLDYATSQSHAITVKVFDSTSQSYSENFTLLVITSLPVAYAQSVSVNENDSVAITLTGFDPQGDPLDYTVTTQPANGSLSGTAPDLVYTPGPGFAGSDSFGFKVNDGSDESAEAVVSITVHRVNNNPVELLVNGSYESGASNFVFTGNAGNVPLNAGMAGQWVSRELGEDSNMDLLDIGGLVSGQDGSVSMLFQITARRGLLQVVDVSQTSLAGRELFFSAAFAAPGREGLTSTDMACYQVIAFNDFTGLTVDIGGSYEFTGGTYDSAVPKRTLADAELSGSAYTTFSTNTTLNSNYNYLAVLVGGLASANNNDTQFVAVDKVTLSLEDVVDIDTDGDGLTDAQEIALGTDPNDSNSVFEINGSTLIPATGQIRLTWPSRAGVRYRVWSSPDDVNWSVTRDWSDAQTPPSDSVEFNLTPSNEFFRVEADIQ